MKDGTSSPTILDHARHLWRTSWEKQRLRARIRGFLRRAKGWPPFRGADGKGPATLVFSEHPYAAEGELLLACQAEAGGCPCYLVGSPNAEAYWSAMGFGRDRFIPWQKYMDRFQAESESESRRVLDGRPGFADLKEYTYRGVEIGRHVLSAAGRKHFRALFDPQEEPYQSSVGMFLQRSIQKTLAACAVYGDYGIRQVMLNNPDYDNVGVSRSLVRAGGAYIQFAQPYEESGFILRRYHPGSGSVNPISLSADSWTRIRAVDIADLDGEIDAIVKVKYSGKNMLSRRIGLDSPHMERDGVIRELGLDTSRKTAVIFSHVLWDANMFWGTDLFEGGSEEWLIETVRLAMRNPAVNWIVKVHPANVWKMKAAGRDIVYNDVLALERELGPMPPHVRIVLPERNINPWSVFQVTDVGFTIRGTVGMELPMLGVPVVTAGSGRYAGHGFTIDPSDIDDFKRIVKNVQDIPALTKEQQDLAKRFFWGIFKPRVWRSELFSIPRTEGSHELFFELNPWNRRGETDRVLSEFFADEMREDYLYLGDGR